MAQEAVTIGVLALQGAFIEHISYLNHALPSTSPYPRINAIPIRSPTELAQCAGLVIPGGESTVMHSVAERTPGMLDALLAFVRDPTKPVWGTCAGMILMAEEGGVGGGKVIPGRERQRGWGGIEGLRVWRNLYGTQLESFEAPLTIPELSDPSTPFNAIFIRAPAVHSLRSAPSSSSSSPFSTGIVNSHGLSTPAPTPPRFATPAPGSSSSSKYAPLQTLATLPKAYHPPAPPSDSHLGPSDPEHLGAVMLRQGKKMVTSFHPELSGDVRVHRFWVEKCVLGL